jgi:lipopolysaccharide transport system permease protein
MLPWMFFATALTECGNSLVGNSNLISKVYFPRLIVPTSSVIISLVDFLISSLLLVILMIWYRFVPSADIFFLPLFVILAFGAAFGAGLWTAALMVEYRDFRFIVPFVVQIGFYVTPVGYSSSLVVERYKQYQMLFSLNPLVGIIDGFRWCILGGEQTLYWPAQAMAVGWVALLVTSGIWFFRRTERTFADVI